MTKTQFMKEILSGKRQFTVIDYVTLFPGEQRVSGKTMLDAKMLALRKKYEREQAIQS